MATANVIFAIGSKMGPGGLASLQAGVGMVLQLGKAVFDAIEGTEKFAQAYQKLQVDITKADKASAGLIDTYALIQGANELTAGGLKVTSDELANISKVTADFAQKTGRDATAEFKKFTKALSTGRTTTLKEYGIEIKGTTDKTKVFAKVMEEMEQKAKDANPKLQTTGEKLFAMGNAFETASGRAQVMFNVMGEGEGVLDQGVKVFNDLDAAMKDNMDTMQMMGQEFTEMSSMIEGVIREIGISIANVLSHIPFIGEEYKDIAEELEREADARLERMAQNERAFRERAGRGSVEFTGGAQGPGPAGLGGGGGKAKGKAAEAKDEITDEDLFAGFGERPAIDVAEQEMLAEFQEDALEREREKLTLRSEEIALQMQMRDIQAELQELGAAGVEVGHLQSDFGMIATEEGNELKQEKLDLVAQELELQRTMNEEKIATYEAEKESMNELISLEDTRQKAITGTAKMGGTAFANFAKQRRKEREMERKGMEVEKTGFKSVLADVADGMGEMQLVKAIMETAEGIGAAARYDFASMGQHFASAAVHGAAAAAAFGLSAALGGGGGGGGGGGSKGGGASAASAGTAPPSAGGGGEGEARSQEINVILQGDAATIFDVVQQEDEDRRRHNLDALER